MNSEFHKPHFPHQTAPQIVPSVCSSRAGGEATGRQRWFAPSHSREPCGIFACAAWGFSLRHPQLPYVSRPRLSGRTPSACFVCLCSVCLCKHRLDSLFCTLRAYMRSFAASFDLRTGLKSSELLTSLPVSPDRLGLTGATCCCSPWPGHRRWMTGCVRWMWTHCARV